MRKVKNYFLLIAFTLSGSVNLLNAQIANVPTVKLNNGREMPRFGLGTYLPLCDIPHKLK